MKIVWLAGIGAITPLMVLTSSLLGCLARRGPGRSRPRIAHAQVHLLIPAPVA